MTVKHLLSVSALALAFGFAGAAQAADNNAQAWDNSAASVDDRDVDNSVALDNFANDHSENSQSLNNVRNDYSDNSAELENIANDYSDNSTELNIDATVAVADQDLAAIVVDGSSQSTTASSSDNTTGNANIGADAFTNAAGVVNVPITTGLGNASANGVNIAATAGFSLGN